MEVICSDIEETNKEAADFARRILPSTEHATLVTFSGDLGAGKTSFIKAMAASFGIQDRVTSPTFVLEKIYEISNNSNFSKLVHIDAYRLDSSSELSQIGFDEIMNDIKNLILLEWPEKVSDGIKKVYKHITINELSDESRKITYE